MHAADADDVGTDQSKQPTHVAVETEPPKNESQSNVLSVPPASSDRRPSIEMIPALADIGRSGPAAGEILLASEEDSMSEADSPSGVDEQSEEAWFLS